MKLFRVMSFLPWIHFYQGYTFINEHHKNQSNPTDCNYFFSGAHHALIQIIKSCLGPQRNKYFSPLTTEYKCKRNWFGNDDIFTHPTESGILDWDPRNPDSRIRGGAKVFWGTRVALAGSCSQPRFFGGLF